MSILVKNSELTKDMMISLSHKLGISQSQVAHFFLKQSKKPRNVRVEAYSKLLRGNVLSSLYRIEVCLPGADPGKCNGGC